jgi:hypothetical protein
MRIEVKWLSEEKRVLHIVYHANWDWDDFAEHRRQAKALVQEVPYSVPVLMEYDRDANLLPPNALRNLSIAAETSDPKAFVVMVMPSQFWRVVIVLLKRLLPNSSMKNSHIVNSRQAALELLEQRNSNAYE